MFLDMGMGGQTNISRILSLRIPACSTSTTTDIFFFWQFKLTLFWTARYLCCDELTFADGARVGGVVAFLFSDQTGHRGTL